MVSNNCPVHDFAIEQLVRPEVSDSVQTQAVVFFSWRLENDDKSRAGSCVLSHNITTGNWYVSPSAYEGLGEISQLELDADVDDDVEEEVYFDIILSSLCGQALSKSIEVNFEDMKDTTFFVPIEEFGEMLSEYM